MFGFRYKAPPFRFVSEIDKHGDILFFTEEWHSFWPFPGAYLYVSGSISYDYEVAQDNFDRICKLSGKKKKKQVTVIKTFEEA